MTYTLGGMTMITELGQAIRTPGHPLRVVAARAVVPGRTIMRIIHNQVDPKLSTMVAIAETVGCELTLTKKEVRK